MATNNAVNTSLSGQSGTGSFAGTTSPTFVTPVLGTPTSGNLANCTGFPAGSLSGLGAGIATFLATPSSANLATALTDETGSGLAVFNNAPTLIAPVLGAASATSLTFSSTSGIIGTTTNNNAAALSVGEFVDSGIVSGTIATSLTSQNMTSISLTAGDWDVYGAAVFTPAAGSNTQFFCGINTTSATLPTLGGTGYWQRSDTSLNNDTSFNQVRLSLAATTTVYLVGRVNFPTAAPAFAGQLSARRRR